MSNPIYLDYASATPVDDRVLKAMSPFWQNNFYNASTIYLGGQEAKRQLAGFRQTIAEILGVKSAEIIFTSSGTEANNLAIKGIMNNFSKEASALTTAIEHSSVLEPLKNYKHKVMPLQFNGRLAVDELKKSLTSNTVLVSVQYANNEIGTIQDLKAISNIITEVRKSRLKNKNKLPIYLHSDACQAVNYLNINPSRLGVDLMTINGGKIYGPKGSGLLYVKSPVKLKPLIEGGGQEFGLRSGTENLAAVAGLAKALKIAITMRQNESLRLAKLSKNFCEAVLKTMPLAELNSPTKNRLPNILNFSFNNIDNERLIMRLDMAGVYCSAGSACSASSEEPSHVLSALKLGQPRISSSIRFSMGRMTTEFELKKAVKILADCLDKEQ